MSNPSKAGTGAGQRFARAELGRLYELEALEARALLSAGDLDGSFGSGGVFWGGFSSFSGLGYTRIAVRPDGRLVIAGMEGSPNEESGTHVIQLSPDGRWDTSFGEGGKVFESEVDGYAAEPDDLTIDASGRILLTGDGWVRGMLRLRADGSRDTSFGEQGEREWPAWGTATGTYLLPDGRILSVGDTPAKGAADWWVPMLFRMHEDGRLDRSFGDDGLVRLPRAFGTQNIESKMLPDGKVLILRYGGWGGHPTLMRLNADGTIDEGFGTAGQLDLPPLANGWSFDVDADGKIAVIGDGSAQRRGEPDAVVWRYNADGTPDLSFGIGGRSVLELGAKTSWWQTLVQADGKIVLVGGAERPKADGEAGGSARRGAKEGSDLMLLRFNADGTPDRAFGDGGVVRYSGDKLHPLKTGAEVVEVDGALVVVSSTLEDPRGWTGDLMVLKILLGDGGEPTGSAEGIWRETATWPEVVAGLPGEEEGPAEGESLFGGVVIADPFVQESGGEGDGAEWADESSNEEMDWGEAVEELVWE